MTGNPKAVCGQQWCARLGLAMDNFSTYCRSDTVSTNTRILKIPSVRGLRWNCGPRGTVRVSGPLVRLIDERIEIRWEEVRRVSVKPSFSPPSPSPIAPSAQRRSSFAQPLRASVFPGWERPWIAGRPYFHGTLPNALFGRLDPELPDDFR